MSFAPGDRVHIVRLGSGVVREVRNSGRYVVEIKGTTMIVEGGQMERLAERKGRGTKSALPRPEADAVATGAASSLDLHGKTVEEAIAALDLFLNDAILGSLPEVRVIHGRSGGRLKAAVHRRLRDLPPVRAFRVDPKNPGVTLVTL